MCDDRAETDKKDNRIESHGQRVRTMIEQGKLEERLGEGRGNGRCKILYLYKIESIKINLPFPEVIQLVETSML